jgi:hypothetical protein
MRAFQSKRWSDAVTDFERARRANPTESGTVTISEKEKQPYIPSYFLGVALVRVGECSAALEAFAVAEAGATVGKSDFFRTKIAQEKRSCRPR